MVVSICTVTLMLLALFQVGLLQDLQCSELDTDVLIVGAGLAGIQAGRRLSRRFDDFIILEGQNDIGGRIKNVPFHGASIEVGANWIQGSREDGDEGHRRRNPILHLRDRFGLRGNFTDYDDLTMYVSNGEIPSDEIVDEYFEELESIVEHLEENLADSPSARHLSIRQALQRQNWRPIFEEYVLNGTAKFDLEAIRLFVEWLEFDFCSAESPMGTSLFYTLPLRTYTHYGEDDFFVADPDGYNKIVKGIANIYLRPDYNSDPRLHLNEVVTTIERSDSCVCASTNVGRYCAKYLIYTGSLGTLQQKTVNFEPDLPVEKWNAINSFTMALYLKIFVYFDIADDEIFWDNTEFVGIASTARGYYPVFEPFNAGNGRFYPNNTKILLFTATGTEAKRISLQDPVDTIEEIYAVLQEIYGDKARKPSDIIIPDWYKNPLFHGAFTVWPPTSTLATFKRLGKNEGRVYFGGEHTDSKYYGFVHGAFESGRRVGKQVAMALQKNM